MGFAEEFIKGYAVGRNSVLMKKRIQMEEEDRQLHIKADERETKRQGMLDEMAAKERSFQNKRRLIELGRESETLPEGTPTTMSFGPAEGVEGNFTVPVNTAKDLRAALLEQAKAKVLAETTVKREAEAFPVPGLLAELLGVPPGSKVSPEQASVGARIFGEQEGNKRAAAQSAENTRGFFQAYTDPSTGEPVGINYKTGKVVRAGDLDPRLKGASLASRGIDVTTQQELTGRLSALQDLDRVTDRIEGVAQTFGPLSGRLMNVQISQLGGLGASKEEKELAVRMRSLVRDVAFANGGKQLTGTEKEEFTATLPQFQDTVEQAITKARVASDIFRRHYKNRILSVPLSTRGQLDQVFFHAAGIEQPGKGVAPTVSTPQATPKRIKLRSGRTVIVEEEQ